MRMSGIYIKDDIVISNGVRNHCEKSLPDNNDIKRESKIQSHGTIRFFQGEATTGNRFGAG
jgi:hypothetical protein